VDENEARAAARARPVADPEEIAIRALAAAGVVVLNRPGAFNALTEGMRTAIAAALVRWARDPEIYAVVIKSAHPGAFCAGADARALAASAAKRAARAQLAQSYALAWQLECFTKPTVSLIDGAVMGGGIGISLYGTHRVAGRRYLFALPEVGLGLIPDHGVCHVLARLPHEVGLYLALTGEGIGAADAYRLGLVTHLIAREEHPVIEAALAAADTVDPLLDERHQDWGPGRLEPHLPAIAHCFSAASVAEIRARLGRLETPWARQALQELALASPEALEATYEHIRAARVLDLRETLTRDFRAGWRLIERADLPAQGGSGPLGPALAREGDGPERSAQDRGPVVRGSYFAPLGEDELRLPTRARMQGLEP
jgi:enoyl-CoA hydratase